MLLGYVKAVEFRHPCDQSYKGSVMANYDSTVVLNRKCMYSIYCSFYKTRNCLDSNLMP